MLRYFVTATDTGVGKTEVACALLRLMARAGRPFAFKPFESGVADLAAPEDSLRLREAGGGWQDLALISPNRYRAPLAPGVAARLERRRGGWARALAAYRRLRGDGVVEGAGGLLVPLDGPRDVAALLGALRLPVVLVARAGLGTLNHASLSLEALQRRRATVAAVVLVQASAAGDPSVPYNRPELERRFPRLPVLGPVPYQRRRRAREAAFDRALAQCVPGQPTYEK